MKSGWKTSECHFAAAWLLIAIHATAWIIVSPPQAWPAALATTAVVVASVWFAGVIGNNYGENRFRLKAVQLQALAQNEGDEDNSDKKPISFGFGRFADVSDQQEREDTDD